MSAVALREADARQAHRGELCKDLRVVMALAVVGRNGWGELAGTEITDRLHELLLVLCQRQVEHLSIRSASETVTGSPSVSATASPWGEVSGRLARHGR